MFWPNINILIAIKTTWELHGLRVLFGMVHLRGLVQQSYDRDLWFIAFNIADSTQNAIFCQQEAGEFRDVERQKARMETALKVVYHKGHGMRVKQCHMFPLTAVCSSKLSQTNTNRCFSFIFLLLIFLHFLFWCLSE